MLRTPDAVLSALRARQEALGLSNITLEELCGLCQGQANRWLGPAREKSPTLNSLMTIAQALGLGLQVVEDPDAVARHRDRWHRRAHRQARPATRVSKIALERARSTVLAELGRQGGRKRWKDVPKAERRAAAKALVALREAKRSASMEAAP